MVKRRSMVVGLGALATGSGAVFSSAAFESSTTATSDFRVVVEDDLTVEPGPAFRDGGTEGDYESGDDDPPYVTGDDALYDGLDSPGLDGLLDDADELPAMYVSDDTNGDLQIELAVPNRHSEDETTLDEDNDPSAGDPFEGTFSEVLQVRNEGTEELDFGITFANFGDIVTNEDAGDGEVLTENVYGDIFTFDRNGGGQISSNGYDSSEGEPDNSRAQTVANDGTTIGVGETVPIDLNVSLDGYTEAIREAATPGTDEVFNDGSEGTVQLVRTLRFGALDSSDAF